MLGIERRRKIMERLVQDRKIYVSDLSRLFSVTEETIRRDLEKLEAEGLVSRTYGGAILNENKLTEGIHYFKRTAINVEAKKAIKAAFQCQLDGRGFGFVELLSACPTNWRMTPLQANERVEKELIPYFPLGVFKDDANDPACSVPGGES